MSELTIDSNDLSNGLYLLYWEDGGISEASVGRTKNGEVWYAPTNWTSVPCHDWGLIKRVQRVSHFESEDK